MVVPWTEIPDREWAKVGTPVATHEFCNWLFITGKLTQAVCRW